MSIYGADQATLQPGQGAGAQVVSPVQQQAVPGMESFWARTAGTLLETGGALKDAADKAAAASATTATIDSFRRGAEDLQQARDSGALTPDMYKVEMQKLYKTVPTAVLSTNEFSTFYKNFTLVGSGFDALQQQKQETERDEAYSKQAYEMGFGLEYTNADGTTRTRMRELLDQRKALSEKEKRVGTLVSINEGEAQLEAQAIMSEQIDNRLALAREAASALSEGVKSGAIDAAAGREQLAMIFRPLKESSAQIQRLGGKGFQGIDTAIKDLEKDYEDFAMGKVSGEFIAFKNRTVVEAAKAEMYEKIPAATYLAASKDFIHLFNGDVLKIEVDVMKLIKGRAQTMMLEEQGISQDDAVKNRPMILGVESDKIQTTFVQSLTNSAAKWESLTPEQQHAATGDVKAFLHQMDVVSRGGRVDLQQLNKASDFLSSPSFKKLVDKGIIGPEWRKTAISVIDRTKGNYLYDYAARALEAPVKIGDKTVQAMDMVDVEMRGGNIVFTTPQNVVELQNMGFGGKDWSDQSTIQIQMAKVAGDFNENMGRTLNSLVKTYANLENKTVEQWVSDGGLMEVFPHMFTAPEADEFGQRYGTNYNTRSIPGEYRRKRAESAAAKKPS